jgi:DNA-binding HxlR family transcriptional regulator
LETASQSDEGPGADADARNDDEEVEKIDERGHGRSVRLDAGVFHMRRPDRLSESFAPAAPEVAKIFGENRNGARVSECRKRIESLPMVGGGLDYSAPFQRAIELIGKRWTGAVVKALIPGPARFNQLLAGIPGISDRVLTERLRELESEGIVERLVDPGPPVRVSYRLTARGHALEPVLAAVSRWAESWLEAAAAAVG